MLTPVEITTQEGTEDLLESEGNDMTWAEAIRDITIAVTFAAVIILVFASDGIADIIKAWRGRKQ